MKPLNDWSWILMRPDPVQLCASVGETWSWDRGRARTLRKIGVSAPIAPVHKFNWQLFDPLRGVTGWDRLSASWMTEDRLGRQTINLRSRLEILLRSPNQ